MRAVSFLVLCGIKTLHVLGTLNLNTSIHVVIGIRGVSGLNTGPLAKKTKAVNSLLRALH